MITLPRHDLIGHKKGILINQQVVCFLYAHSKYQTCVCVCVSPIKLSYRTPFMEFLRGQFVVKLQSTAGEAAFNALVTTRAVFGK